MTTGSDDRTVSELAALIQAQQRAGLSYEDMARTAHKAGRKDISKQYLAAVANGGIKRPSSWKLAGIAAALPNIGETTVREAAGRQAGTHVEHNVPFRTGQMLSRVEHMSPVNRDRWFRLAQAIADTLAAEEPYVPDTVVLTESGRAPDAVTEKVTDRLTAEAVERAERTRRRRRQA